MNSFNFGGQNADPEIVRENFNKIARYLTAADACVLSLQSQSANISALGANAAIRTFTVFMRSDTGACDVTIPDPAIFDYSVIGKKDTLFFFKGLSGASSKTININAGTVEGAASFTLANDQTVCIQSDGTEYKILFDTAGMTGGSGDTPDRFGLEDITTPNDRAVDIENHLLTLTNVQGFTVNDAIGAMIAAAPGYASIGANDGTGYATITTLAGGSYDMYILTSDGTGGGVTIILNSASSSALIACTVVVIQAGLQLQYIAVNGNYTILRNDYAIDCVDIVGPNSFTVTLPDSTDNRAGQIYVIKNSGTGTITVNTFGGQLIDGASTYTLNTKESITAMVGNSSYWMVIAKV